VRVLPDCEMIRAGWGDLWLYSHWCPVGIGGRYPDLWFALESVS